MRDYAKVSPQFWVGKTGKALRAAGMEAQLIAMYLMTCPHANMLGLYYLPKLYISHETGRTIEGASEGLKRCIESGFCSYDETTEMVWVHEMASYQIGEQLEPTDKRCLGIQRDYDALPDNAFLGVFFERYRGAFHLKRSRGISPSGGALKPLRSQEQEQEQEQEGEGLPSEAPDTPPAKPSSRKRSVKRPIPDDFGLTQERQAYAEKHLPDVDAAALMAVFRSTSKAKAWQYADWDQHWQTLVRQWAPNSGHWSSGQYPRIPATRSGNVVPIMR